ncbi:MAG: CsbD family protein [Actinomycetota bacterium]|nr:CsbD family protein [Actinomycetota bacterium]
MGEKTDEMKGRAKEAVGALTDDDDLKREGKLDQATSSVKGKVEDAKDKIEDLVDDVKDKVKDKLDR